MNNELTDLLRSVLKEELEPVNKRLDAIETNGKEHAKRFDAIDQELSEHAKRLDGIDQDLKEHTKRFDGVDEDLKELKDGQERLQKNIIFKSR
jgi:chromosome segregation ATPase